MRKIAPEEPLTLLSVFTSAQFHPKNATKRDFKRTSLRLSILKEKQ